MRSWGLLLAAAWLGCGHPRTQVRREDGVDFSRYRHIGVLPFKDARGKGRVISDGINGALGRLMYEPVDLKRLEALMTKYKFDKDTGFGQEALEYIRSQTSADALVLGQLAPDWSVVSIMMIETEMGDPILRAVIRPAKKSQAAFAGPDEVVAETLSVLLGKR